MIKKIILSLLILASVTLSYSAQTVGGPRDKFVWTQDTNTVAIASYDFVFATSSTTTNTLGNGAVSTNSVLNYIHINSPSIQTIDVTNVVKPVTIPGNYKVFVRATSTDNYNSDWLELAWRYTKQPSAPATIVIAPKL